jgi:hypothetical protein
MPSTVKYPFGVKVSVAPPDPARQPPDSSWVTTEFGATATTISKSWGLQPGSASIRYAGSEGPISAGHYLTIKAGGHVFAGICMKDVSEFGSNGQYRNLDFVDFRELLQWDDVYGYFNKVNRVTVGGQRYRRYEHILPSNWINGVKTYTNNPLSAQQIISYLITSPYNQTPWVIKYCHPTTGVYTSGYHPSFVNPAYDIDCYNGKTVGQAISEVCEQHGILFTIGDNPFDLVFARKGEGPIPAAPTISDNRRNGTVISRNPTRVRVVGDRNVYQCHGINMVPDWAPGGKRSSTSTSCRITFSRTCGRMR